MEIRIMKRSIQLIICFILLFTNINYVYADGDVSVNWGDFKDNSGNIVDEESLWKPYNIPSGAWGKSDSSTKNYYCSYDAKITHSNSLNYSFRDMENNKLLTAKGVINTDKNHPVSSGTYIGINVFDFHRSTYTVRNVKAGYKEFVKTYKPVVTCSYKIKDSLEKSNSITESQKDIYRAECTIYSCEAATRNNCKIYEHCETTLCSPEYKLSGEAWEDHPYKSNSKEFKDCQNQAVKETRSKIGVNSKERYEVLLSNSNKVSSVLDKESQVKTTMHKTIDAKWQNGSSTALSDSYTYSILYGMTSVCLDPVKGEVTYPSGSCIGNQLKIDDYYEGTSPFFHYFIPLNAKDNDEIEINIREKKANKVDDLVNYIKSNLDIYKDTIKCYSPKDLERRYPISGFLGGIKNGEPDSRMKKFLSDNSCYITIVIKVTHKNKFYHTSGGKIDGFNFYFRKIDLNNPFPKGVSNVESLWYKYYHSNIKDLKLGSVSYTSSTEQAKYASRISDSLFSWRNMDASGENRLIGSNAIATRIRNDDNKGDNVSKLGLGPLLDVNGKGSKTSICLKDLSGKNQILFSEIQSKLKLIPYC